MPLKCVVTWLGGGHLSSKSMADTLAGSRAPITDEMGIARIDAGSQVALHMSWIAFIDETGDHGLNNIDPGSPMFAVTAAVYRETEYLDREVAAIAKLKHSLWGHEGVILRSYDINQRAGPYSFLQVAEQRQAFFDAVTNAVRTSTVSFIGAVIDKPRHAAQYTDPAHVYHLAFQFLLERIYMKAGKGVKLVIESRGKKEDAELAGWCEQISNGGNYDRKQFEFESCFVSKKMNIAGLQMADLACQPITHYAANRTTERPDWLAVKSRLHTDWRGRFEGCGLKIFPS
jgi:Protein of unknown function (DUF3800)